uniref:Uncharacterized protein n=1 Tax=Leersia perrieri TaxID=77586 RepID=A0A0D9WI22_9ORYZ
MAALRLAARRVVAAGLGRPQSTGLVSRAVEERLLPRLIHGSAPPSPVPSCYSFGRLNFSTTSAGKPPKSVHETPGRHKIFEGLDDRINKIDETKAELFCMLADLDVDYPSRSKYSRDSRKLLYMIAKHIRDGNSYIDDPLWPIYERRSQVKDMLKYGLYGSILVGSIGYLKFFS